MTPILAKTVTIIVRKVEQIATVWPTARIVPVQVRKKETEG